MTSEQRPAQTFEEWWIAGTLIAELRASRKVARQAASHQLLFRGRS